MASESEKLAEPVLYAGASSVDAPHLSVPAGAWLVGTLTGFNDQGAPEVKVVIEDQWHNLTTTPTVAVSRSDLGRQAVVMTPGGALSTPLLMGFVHTPLTLALEAGRDKGSLSHSQTSQSMSVEVDEAPAREVALEGREKLVLRCGSASITLTEAGKIILRGRHLVSRSEGVNRILGASIQMN